MDHVEAAQNTNSDGETLDSFLKASPSPDPGFSRLLEGEPDESAKKPYMEKTRPTPAMAKYNVHNLLNGQFPPPDSGAGYIFAHVALIQES